ncbi:MAG: hypothetical protein V3T61_06915 [Acidobacteriota bacterium]
MTSYQKPTAWHQVLFLVSTGAHLSRLRCLSIAAGCLHIALASSLILGQGPEEPFPARQNPILRQYFRKQFYETRVLHNRRIPSTPTFVEHFVDRQIDYYLRKLREKLDSMSFHFAHLEGAVQGLRPGLTEQNRSQARELWRKSLEQIHDDSGALRSMISYVFTELKNKDSGKAHIRPDAIDSGFQEERVYLGEQISEAEHRIRGYFFKSKNTIQVEELKGENMLIHLHRVREVSKAMKKAW